MNPESGEQFIEQMGLVLQAAGMPRIAGRLFGYLLVHGGTHSFSSLTEKLQVSRGSISTNARLLESLGVLHKTARPGDRQDYFHLADDPYGRLLRGYIQRMEGTRRLVADLLNDVGAEDDAAERLRQMQLFYDITLESTRQGLQTWSRVRNSK